MIVVTNTGIRFGTSNAYNGKADKRGMIFWKIFGCCPFALG